MMTRGCMTIRLLREQRSRRRGSAYLLILMVSMIITLIGLSALQISRIQLRISGTTSETSEAGVLAISGVDLGLYTITDDPAWRNTYTNNVWATKGTLGGGTISFKIVDESDGSLDSGPAGPVRLYGRGIVDQTVQMCSVIVETSNTIQTGSWRQEVNP